MTEEASRTLGSPAVKICGLTRKEDAREAVNAGAGFLGVVLVPGTPRALTAHEAGDLFSGLSVPVVAVLADVPLDQAATEGTACAAGVLQLHGRESPEYVDSLRGQGPWAIWKALRVRTPDDVRRGLDGFGELVDGILLDGWHPHRKGGTGSSFSWKDVEAVRECFPAGLKLILAGGLTPRNVDEAIRRLNPDIVDVSSGVESSPGIKDSKQIKAFIQSARQAGKGEGR